MLTQQWQSGHSDWFIKPVILLGRGGYNASVVWRHPQFFLSIKMCFFAFALFLVTDLVKNCSRVIFCGLLCLSSPFYFASECCILLLCVHQHKNQRRKPLENKKVSIGGEEIPWLSFCECLSTSVSPFRKIGEGWIWSHFEDERLGKGWIWFDFEDERLGFPWIKEISIANANHKY